MTVDPTVLELLEQNLVRSSLVATGTVLVYDYLCTLDQEIAYVWNNPRSIASLLFFVNRYLPFVDTFLALRLRFSHDSPEECLAKYTLVTWLVILGTFLSEAILFLRTYAIWECKRPVLIILLLLSFTVLPAALVITHFEIKSLVYVSSPRGGCLLDSASPLIIVAFILLVICETVTAILTAIKAYQHLQELQAGWVIQLYKDGIIFYFFLLPISLANIIVPFYAPDMFSNWLPTPQRVVHSVLCTRVLFLVFRQRSASTMTNRLPVARDRTGPNAVSIASIADDETTASMHMVTVMSEQRSPRESFENSPDFHRVI